MLFMFIFLEEKKNATIKGNCLQNKKNYEYNLRLILNEEKESKVD